MNCLHENPISKTNQYEEYDYRNSFKSYEIDFYEKRENTVSSTQRESVFVNPRNTISNLSECENSYNNKNVTEGFHKRTSSNDGSVRKSIFLRDNTHSSDKSFEDNEKSCSGDVFLGEKMKISRGHFSKISSYCIDNNNQKNVNKRNSRSNSKSTKKRRRSISQSKGTYLNDSKRDPIISYHQNEKTLNYSGRINTCNTPYCDLLTGESNDSKCEKIYNTKETKNKLSNENLSDLIEPRQSGKLFKNQNIKQEHMIYQGSKQDLSDLNNKSHKQSKDSFDNNLNKDNFLLNIKGALSHKDNYERKSETCIRNNSKIIQKTNNLARSSSTKKVNENHLKHNSYNTSNASSLDKLRVDMISYNKHSFKKINNDSSTLIGTTQANSNCISKTKFSCNNDFNYIEDCYFDKKRNSKN